MLEFEHNWDIVAVIKKLIVQLSEGVRFKTGGHLPSIHPPFYNN